MSLTARRGQRLQKYVGNDHGDVEIRPFGIISNLIWNQGDICVAKAEIGKGETGESLQPVRWFHPYLGNGSKPPYSPSLITMPRPLSSTCKVTMMSPPSPVDELTATLFDALLSLPTTRKAGLLLDISLSLIDAGRCVDAVALALSSAELNGCR